MARKNDSFYFDGFKQSADYACQAAHLLSEVMHHYEPDRLLERFDEMHRIEQAADEDRHGMMDELVTAFITPFDRDDIARLSSVLDDVTDRIEGALHRMYYDNVLEIRPDALDLVDMVERSCGKMAELIGELPRFKRSKTLREQVFFINKIEQDADRLFVEAMRRLHTTCTDPLQVLARGVRASGAVHRRLRACRRCRRQHCHGEQLRAVPPPVPATALDGNAA